MLSRFLLYGVAGWTLEVLFTGVCSALGKDRAATSKTYLWMHPIYGGAALGLEQMERALQRRRVPFAGRALAHTAAIFGAEYATGFLLKRVLGKCPWDYGECGGRSVHGLIRLDYAPLWFGVAALFSLTRPHLEQMAEPPKTRWQLIKKAVLPRRSEAPPLVTPALLRGVLAAVRAVAR